MRIARAKKNSSLCSVAEERRMVTQERPYAATTYFCLAALEDAIQLLQRGDLHDAVVRGEAGRRAEVHPGCGEHRLRG